jgi:hypothetical protein
LTDVSEEFTAPDDGGSKLLWNVGQYLPDYTLLNPRGQPSSYRGSLFPGLSELRKSVKKT